MEFIPRFIIVTKLQIEITLYIHFEQATIMGNGGEGGGGGVIPLFGLHWKHNSYNSLSNIYFIPMNMQSTDLRVLLHAISFKGALVTILTKTITCFGNC